MRLFDEYIIVSPGSDYSVAGMSELKMVPECTFYDYVIDESSSNLLKKLHHIHFSFALNRFFDIPFHGLWRKRYVLKKEQLSAEKKYCIIFSDISACRVDTGYLKELQSCPNVTMVLTNANVVSRKERLMKSRFKYFSEIFSFDKGDCEKYGFHKYTTYYSKLPLEIPEKLETDAFFVGVSKGQRHEKLVKLYRRLKAENAKVDFYLANHNDLTNREEGIHYNDWLSYDDVLQKVMKTNCLVEIVDNNHQGFTLRTVEALCYNKRLVTNNASVKDLKYYNTGFILYTPNVEDADLSFIMSDAPVEYNYENEYSPIHFLDDIDEVVSKQINDKKVEQ